MSSGDIIPNDHDQPEPASHEIQFALVIARMIDTIKNNPEDMRQAVYELARYKLQEQFTHADARDIKRTQQALETAIQGVENFSMQQLSLPAQHRGDIALPASDLVPKGRLPALAEPQQWARDPTPVPRPRLSHPQWPLIRRTALVLTILAGLLIAFQHRDGLRSAAEQLPKRLAVLREPPAPVPSPVIAPPPPPPVIKPNPLLPTNYGIYAISNDTLSELQLLPGRPPDIRVAVSAAFKIPSRTVLSSGRPRFIVFRRDVAGSVSDRAEVRVIAKIAREFSTEGAGKKPADGEDTWIIRNITYAFRASPVKESPEMYELNSEDSALELTPGRYALVLKSQAYDFTVDGKVVDPKQCIERIVATNGTFYSDCKRL